MNMVIFPCPVCLIKLKTTDMLILHVKMMHESAHGRFYCPYSRCPSSFSSIYSYKSHLQKMHTSVAKFTDTESFQSCEETIITKKKRLFKDCEPPCFVHSTTDPQITIESLPLSSGESGSGSFQQMNSVGCQIPPDFPIDFEPNVAESSFDHDSLSIFLHDLETKHAHTAATLALKLYADNSLSRATANNILKTVNEFHVNTIQTVRKTHNLSTCSDSLKINMTLDILQNSLSDFRTEHKCFEFFKNRGLLIQPETIIIESLVSPQLHNEAMPQIRKSSIEFISMKSVLKKFLEIPNVYNSVMQMINKTHPADDVISSMLQCDVWKGIKNQFGDKIVIPLNIFSDAYESNNPLGSHRGLKKLNGVYYSISCLPPEFASQLENLFLSQIHKETDYEEFGNRVMFARLIEELEELGRDGIIIDIGGKQETVYFAVARILGDNLGLNTLLGFQKSFSATYFCRICEATKKETQTQVTEKKTLLRTKQKYQRAASGRTHGIKEECIFNSVISHICDVPTVDPTHDINEGIARYEIGQILHHLILVEQLFSVKEINNRLSSVNVGLQPGTNLPPPFTRKQIKDKMIKNTASEMAFLILHLGVLVGELVPEGHKIWKLYKMLRQIYCLIMAPSFTEKSSKSLKNLITRHHKLYIELFGNLKPKHHFLLHYVLAMKKLGPLRFVATIRYEGKHKDFKHTAHNVTSRINPAHTLAQKHQLQLTHRLYLNKPMENVRTFGKEYNHHLSLLENIEFFRNLLPEEMSNEIQLLSWIKYDGSMYKEDMAVPIRANNSLPSFGKIKYILKSDDKIYFILIRLKTVKMIEHIQAYHVKLTDNWHVMEKTEFLSHTAYDIFTLPSGKSVISSH